MEELNKNQIVLLTLLVSFVTSIATGIVTVTLVNQAPPAVTQTINRVVERTIEKTVPGETKTTTVIKEVPVIVTEEQLIVDIINGSSPAMVRIADRSGNTLGSGFVVSDDGLIATSHKILPATLPADDLYQVFLGQSRQGLARLIRSQNSNGVSLFRVDFASLRDQDGKSIPQTSLSKLELSDTEAVPGLTLVALGVADNGTITVAGGIVSGLFTDTNTKADFINTSAANQNNLGGPVLNTKGKVVGLANEVGAALTVKMIVDTLASVSR